MDAGELSCSEKQKLMRLARPTLNANFVLATRLDGADAADPAIGNANTIADDKSTSHLSR
jgi:hypothetical protein